MAMKTISGSVMPISDQQLQSSPHSFFQIRFSATESLVPAPSRKSLSAYLDSTSSSTRYGFLVPSPSPIVPSDMDSHPSGFSPPLIAVICFLAAIFLVVSYYALVARFFHSDSNRRGGFFRRHRVQDEHRHGAADEAVDMAGEEGPIFWPEFRHRGLSKEDIEKLPAVEYYSRSLSSRSRSVAMAKDPIEKTEEEYKDKEYRIELELEKMEERSKGVDGDLGDLESAAMEAKSNKADSIHGRVYCGSTDCAVCLSGFVEGEMVRVLPRCSHGYHFACIYGWLTYHRSCPLCRTDVLADPIDSSSDHTSNSAPPATDDVEEAAAAMAMDIDIDGASQLEMTAPSNISHHQRRIIDEALAEEVDGEAIQLLRPLNREQKTGGAAQPLQPHHGALPDGMRKLNMEEPRLGLRCFSTGRASMLSHSHSRDTNYEGQNIARSSSFIFSMGSGHRHNIDSTDMQSLLESRWTRTRERQDSTVETAVDINRLILASTSSSQITSPSPHSFMPWPWPNAYAYDPPHNGNPANRQDKSRSMDYGQHLYTYHREDAAAYDAMKSSLGSDARMSHSLRFTRRSFSGGRLFGFRQKTSNSDAATLRSIACTSDSTRN